MKTHQHTYESENSEYEEGLENSENLDSKEQIREEIQTTVDERGFYLYEWISREELKMSIRADYLNIATKSSIPLAIVTFVMGVIGFALGNITGIILAIFGILFFFYLFVGIFLIFKMLQKWSMYSRIANVIFTDNHLITHSKVFERENFDENNPIFEKTKKLFHEELFESSRLPNYIETQKSVLTTQLGKIFKNSAKILESVNKNSHSDKNNPAGIILLIFIIGGLLFAIMMGITYFIGVPIVYLLASLYARIMHAILLTTNNTEYKIQSLFTRIDNNSHKLQNEKNTLVSSLTEAKNNEWLENLSGRINDAFKKLNIFANSTTNDSITLRKMLEKSKYHDIFNFPKYDTWIKNQVLTPIIELISLLEKNENIVTNTISALNSQILQTSDPSHQKPLELQKKRLELHLEELKKMKQILASYQEKLV